MSQYIDGNAGPRVAGELGVVAGGEEQLRGQVLTSHLLRLVDAECLRSQNYVYHAMLTTTIPFVLFCHPHTHHVECPIAEVRWAECLGM